MRQGQPAYLVTLERGVRVNLEERGDLLLTPGEDSGEEDRFPRAPNLSAARTALTARLNGFTMSFAASHPATSEGSSPAAFRRFTESGDFATSSSMASSLLAADAR